MRRQHRIRRPRGPAEHSDLLHAAHRALPPVAAATSPFPKASAAIVTAAAAATATTKTTATMVGPVHEGAPSLLHEQQLAHDAYVRHALLSPPADDGGRLCLPPTTTRRNKRETVQRNASPDRQCLATEQPVATEPLAKRR